MKSINSVLSILIACVVIIVSCLEDTCLSSKFYKAYEPVYVSEEEFRVPPSFKRQQEITRPGKIYFYNEYIFLNEINAGIHVIDNSNPSNPLKLGFIDIPGNKDVAVKNNVLYADSYVDVLTINISNIEDPQLINRTENVFKEVEFVPGRGYLSHYEETERVEELNCDDPMYEYDTFIDGDVTLINTANTRESANFAPSPNGIAGSMARFIIVSDYLYAIDDRFLYSYQINQGDQAKLVGTIEVEAGIETLFNQGEHLFIGASNGMFIYDIDHPSQPEFVSKFDHAMACDPVFVQDDLAYITLRSGSECRTFINQLDIVDISNIRNPRLLQSYQMENPHGLSVRDSTLYLCEGEYGLKVYDVSSVYEVDQNLRQEIPDIHAFDVISVSPELLLLVGEDGLYQYNAQTPNSIQQISFIQTNN